MSLRRGVFVLSIDFELIWGTLDLRGPEAFRRACERERSEVFAALLALLEQCHISATWCVLGHVMLDSCSRVNGRKHPEIVRPAHAWQRRDWFAHDPCSDERHAPLFYGRSLVERLLEARVAREIGCHGFSHVIFGDPGCLPETAASEVRAALRAAAELGVRPRSFAFPRNRLSPRRSVRAWLYVLPGAGAGLASGRAEAQPVGSDGWDTSPTSSRLAGRRWSCRSGRMASSTSPDR